MEAEPTDGLWNDGRKDVDQLGMSYSQIEYLMNNYRTKKPILRKK